MSSYQVQLLLWVVFYIALGLALRWWMVRRARNGGKR